MSEEILPFCWSNLPFGDCLKAGSSQRKAGIPTAGYQRTGKYPIIDQSVRLIAGWTDDESAVVSDDLPVIVFGDHTRIFKYVDFPFATGADGTKVLRVDEKMDPVFFYFSLLNLNIPSKGYNRHYKLLSEAVIAFPLNKSEQCAIAADLSAIQDARDARRRELDAERERKAALMEDLFTCGTRGETRKETVLGPLPQCWGVASLGDVAPFVQYGTSEKCEADESGTPVLRIPNVIGGRVDVTDLKYACLPEKVTEGLRLVRGDLLFVRTNGNRENTGRCAMYDDDPPSALFASYLIRARLDTGRALPRFVQFYTTTRKGKEYLSGRASNAADGKFNINSQTIKGVQMPLPPLDEQRDIADVLAACDAKIAALEAEATLLDELFRAMLEELMSGRLSALPLVGAEAAP